MAGHLNEFVFAHYFMTFYLLDHSKIEQRETDSYEMNLQFNLIK